MTDVKSTGSFYTPVEIVKLMLRELEYVESNNKIIGKHIIDNSCGDGAFLVEIVDTYCRCCKKNGIGKSELQEHLAKYIHGIELNKDELEKCRARLNQVVVDYGINPVSWNLLCADTMEVFEYDNLMDYVVGNPPYVRVHNLNLSYSSVKKYSFAKTGMTDLYLVFFEIGFKMLSDNGQMALITPSSWFTSKAGKVLRDYNNLYRYMYKCIDLKHYQVFEATTYTAITCFDKKSKFINNQLDYFIYDDNGKKHVDNLSYSIFNINGSYFFNEKRYLADLFKIHSEKENKYALVKNGYATLADNVFIGNFEFKDELIIDCIKASTGKWYKCIYPYNRDGSPIPENDLMTSKQIYKYLKSKESILTKDKSKKYWYLFGRTQAINDTFKKKYSINTTIKGVDSIKLIEVDAGKGIYSGLYIITEINYDQLSSIIKCEEFISYIKSLCKYKSGGYYTYSSKDLEKYINHKLKEIENE